MDARDIIFNYFGDKGGDSSDLESLMGYLDTDTLVGWFVDEGYVEDLYDKNDEEVIMNHYGLHCGR